MGDLFRPKVQVTASAPSATDQAAAATADRERLQALRDQATRRTEQLLRLFGSRSSSGFSGGF